MSLWLTCVLSELMHGLQVYDVGCELRIHLPQYDGPSCVSLQDVFNVMTNGGAVWPPAAVFIHPFPNHHPSHALRRVSASQRHQNPRAGSSHFIQLHTNSKQNGFRPNICREKCSKKMFLLKRHCEDSKLLILLKNERTNCRSQCTSCSKTN